MPIPESAETSDTALTWTCVLSLDTMMCALKSLGRLIRRMNSRLDCAVDRPTIRIRLHEVQHAFTK